MARLGVIGNISVDRPRRPGHPLVPVVGGAAWHVARAATAAGLPAAPIAVIGAELRRLPRQTDDVSLDWSEILAVDGPSARFDLDYDANGRLIHVHSVSGVATGLTEHAFRRIACGQNDAYHVCCRVPLDIDRVLSTLVERNISYSVDFMVSSAAAAIPVAARHLPAATTIFSNVDEFAMLRELVELKDLALVVVSDGPRPARLYRRGELAAVAEPPPLAANWVTGAGDTLAGCFLAARAAGKDDETALHLAVVTAGAHTTCPPLVIGGLT